jgi:flagellar basal body-associated protein FliL
MDAPEQNPYKSPREQGTEKSARQSSSLLIVTIVIVAVVLAISFSCAGAMVWFLWAEAPAIPQQPLPPPG